MNDRTLDAFLAAGLLNGACPEVWNDTHADVVAGIHQGYYDAGSHIVETNTFGGTRPRQVMFGAGQRHALGTVVSALGSRALVCTDARFGATPEFAHLVRLLEDSGVQVTSYAEVEPDVPVHQVVRCAELAAAAEPDVVVGMGGGSCLDLAKAVAVLLTHGGTPADYYGELRVPGPVVPVVALPTTAGTGSEVTPVAVLTDPDRISKVGISSPYLIPHAAGCAPGRRASSW